uniref:Testis-specific Y-encoded-like protein 1 n=1 Tax=Taeniopygia guttata TaxID=59729 RepID=A0A674HBC6_TAEGU
MSGARAGADRPPPAKLRRLDEPSGKGPAAAVTRGEAARSPTPAGGRGEGRRARARGDGAGHAQGGGGDPPAPPGGLPEISAGLAREGPETPGEGAAGSESTGEVPASLETTEETKGRPETIDRCKGSPESASSDCLEQKKGGLETTGEVTEGVESTGEATGDLGIAATHSLEQNKGVLKTPVESEGSLESTSKASGDLESSREGTGSLGSSNGRKGSLETAVTRCLEQGRRSKAGLETTAKVLGSVESDASPGGELKSTSRRKAKTPARPRLSAETAGSLERERSGNGDLDTSREVLAGLEATREDTESLETTIAGCVKRDREQKGGVEFTTEPEEGPEPTACVGQSRGGPGLPDLVGVPEPAGVPVPKEHVAEESAVISLDEDEEEEEEERDEGPARYLAALEAVQLELEAVEEEAARAFRRLRTRFCLRRRPHLQRRNRLIQHIPGFWVTAFLNHPQLSAMISDRDEDALSYMTSLQVEEFGQSRPGCRIRFFFSVNPYFQNDVVAKEFVRGPSGGSLGWGGGHPQIPTAQGGVWGLQSDPLVCCPSSQVTWCPTRPPSGGGRGRTPGLALTRAPQPPAASSRGLGTTASLRGTVWPRSSRRSFGPTRSSSTCWGKAPRDPPTGELHPGGVWGAPGEGTPNLHTPPRTPPPQ